MDKTKVFLANVMDAYVFAGDRLMFTSKALTDSSISLGLTAEEIRGGKGNKLIGRFFHDSSFSLELMDALFNLDYIALNVGEDVQPDAESGSLTEVGDINPTSAGTIEIAGANPADFLGLGRVGWIAIPGSDEWSTFTFNDGEATAQNVKVGTELVQPGTKYCVKYIDTTVCDELIIPGDFIPSEVSVILKGNLYKAGKSNDVSTSSVVGHIEVEVPRLQMNGSMDLSLNSSGAAQVPLSGSALVADDSNSCEGGGHYAKIRDIRGNANWYDNLVAIAIEGSDTIQLVANQPKVVNVYGVFGNRSSRLIEPAKLSYSIEAGTATVANGIINPMANPAAGTLTVSVLGKEEITVTADITV